MFENDRTIADNNGGWFKRLRSSLSKTRQDLTVKLDRLVLGKKEIDASTYDELEELLISADMGVKTSLSIIEKIKDKSEREHLKNAGYLRDALKEEILNILSFSDNKIKFVPGRVNTLLVLGVNGSGKTTTIGKLSKYLAGQNHRVLLAAADTFRAAAIDQLAIWAKHCDVDILKHQEGADPSAVVFDAIQFAASKKYDFLIIDTAGRLHTKHNLMEELKKMQRVLQKNIPGAPHETLLVLDAVNGQNAIIQAQSFHAAFNVTGIILTKLDSSAKGGAVVGITNELKIPLKFIGIGEKIDDLREFDPNDFVNALFSI